MVDTSKMTSSSSDAVLQYREVARPEASGIRYPGFSPGRILFESGQALTDGAARLSCDIVMDRDVAVELRDGVTIYTDIYRPADRTDLPTIVAWSPYGKRDGAILLDDFPFRAGVPRDVLSGLEKFEGPDPAYWCAHGYAVANPDARGAYASEGDIRMWNNREGQDGADVVDWLGEQPWSNGKVGLAGTSWLAVAQWFIAAEHPKHLAAIAPWEGVADVYRSALAPGGIIDPGFVEWLVSIAVGKGRIEDLPAMLLAHPTVDAWNAYIANVATIDVPAYVVASWANVLHSRGTFQAWRGLGTAQKWLRVHASLEWPDFYQPHNQEDLRRFFDQYLIGVETGWTSTPPVRVDIVDPGGETTPNQSEDAFPPTRTQTQTLFLAGSNGSLLEETPSADLLRYNPLEAPVHFSYVFDDDVELLGYPRLTVHLEVEDSDDADLFAKLSKVTPRGHVLGVQLLPLRWRANAEVADDIAALAQGHLRPLYYYDGPWARLRASHRAQDESRSALVPFHTYCAEERLQPRQVVEMELGFTAIGMRFRRGEILRLTVGGINTAVWAAPDITQPELRNQGRHVLHFGGQYASRLQLPISRRSRV